MLDIGYRILGKTSGAFFHLLLCCDEPVTNLTRVTTVKFVLEEPNHAYLTLAAGRVGTSPSGEFNGGISAGGELLAL